MKYLFGILILFSTLNIVKSQAFWFHNNKQLIPDSVKTKSGFPIFIYSQCVFKNDTNFLTIYLVNNSDDYFCYGMLREGFLGDLKIKKTKNHFPIYPLDDGIGYCGNSIILDSIQPGVCLINELTLPGYKEDAFDEDTIFAKVYFNDFEKYNFESNPFTLYFPKRKYKTKDSISGRFLGHYDNEIAVNELKNIIDSLVVYNIYTNTIDERYIFSQATIVLVTPDGIKSFPVNSNKLNEVVLNAIKDLPVGSKILIDNIKVKGKQPFDDHRLYTVIYNVE